MITKTILIKKGVWDLVKTRLQLLRESLTFFGKEIKEGQMAFDIVRYIIVEGVSFQITFSIMNLKDPRDMWTKLKSICNKVG